MPRKRWKYKVTCYDVPRIDPGDRHANSDEELVSHALVDLEELAVLPDAIREHLIADLVDAVRYARAGVAAGKVGISNEATTQQVYMADVARAMERAGLDPTRWRKQYDNGDGESLYYRVGREVADVTGLRPIPKDPKLVGQRASQIVYSASGGLAQTSIDAAEIKPSTAETQDK
jgi:hypothetical protein